MAKIDKTSWQGLLIEIAVLIVVAIILWPLLDMLWAAVITHSEFTYSVGEHIVGPIIFGIIAGIIFWLFDRQSAKKK